MAKVFVTDSFSAVLEIYFQLFVRFRLLVAYFTFNALMLPIITSCAMFKAFKITRHEY